jgi:hypothetical protein
MLHALIFATQALIVFYWAKNLGTEKTFTLWLKGPVVDSFRLFLLHRMTKSGSFLVRQD